MPEFTDPSARLDDKAWEASTATGHVPTGDPDLDSIALGEESSDLDDLEGELAVITDLVTTIEVPKRPRYSLRCRTDFTGHDLDLIRRKCRDKKFSDGVDGVKFASLLLASYTVAILRDGEPLELDGEQPVTFTSKALQGKLQTTSADPTVRKFYGLEGHVDSAGRRLMSEAGYGDDVYADPTA